MCHGLRVFMPSHQPSAALSAQKHTQHGQMKQQCRAFLSTRGLRADDEGDSLKVYDLVRGLEVVELTGHPDHVMCGSMS